MAHHSPEQVWADWWVRLPARCCACCLLQGADATLIRTGRRHHPKALADGRWREKEPDQQRLCQQPHLALLALASLPRGGRGGGLRSQHRGALPWKGTKEVRREERGERAWHFSLLEWNTPVLGKTLVGFVPDPPSTVRNMNPFPSCASSFSANLSPKFNINITKNEFFFGWGVLPCLWYKYACAWTFFPVSHLTGDNHSVCDAHPREPKHVHTCIPTPPPPNPLLSPGSALVECLWGVGHRAEKFTLLFFSLKSRKRRQLKKKTLILRLMLNTLFYIDWASHFPTMGQVESRWPRAR